jgi:cellulose synthase/poly-beta-1,6-N-acetylglucosamine synthase-like glycosyltransferase
MGETAAPFVSVIVPVFDDAEGLVICLRALDRQTYPQERFEVLVVDNGSRASVAPLVAPFGRARPLEDRTPGSYAARNAGLAEARGEILAFTDADCIPEPDWLARGVAHLLDDPSRRRLIAGRIDMFPRDPRRPSAVELYECLTALRQEEYVARGEFGATANLFAPREAFERAGPFDGSVKSGGDREWCRRAIAAGYELTYAPDAAVAHPARRSLGQLTRRATRIIGGLFESSLETLGPYRGIGRGGLRDALPPVRAALGVLGDPRVPGLWRKFCVVAIMVFVQYVQVWEMLRLRLGGVSRR